MPPNPQVLEVQGDLACFSRPETKVERFSYPVITPSAARGIFEAIYAKPTEFRWQVSRVEVLSEPSFLALRRNEVKEKISFNAVVDWMRGKAEPEPLFADADSETSGSDLRGRTQRQTMALRRPHYRLTAEIRPHPEHSERLPAFEAQFRRRAALGKTFYQPFFGCREFPAYFRLLEPGAKIEPPIPLDLEIGWMLYDVFDLEARNDRDARPAVSLFQASVRAGVLEIPEYSSPQVFKALGGA